VPSTSVSRSTPVGTDNNLPRREFDDRTHRRVVSPEAPQPRAGVPRAPRGMVIPARSVIKASMPSLIDPPAEPTEETTARHAEYRVTPPTPSMAICRRAGDLTRSAAGTSKRRYLAAPPGARTAAERCRGRSTGCNQGVRRSPRPAHHSARLCRAVRTSSTTCADLQAVPPLDDTWAPAIRSSVLDIDDAVRRLLATRRPTRRGARATSVRYRRSTLTGRIRVRSRRRHGLPATPRH
jgi:hypothetical protein